MKHAAMALAAPLLATILAGPLAGQARAADLYLFSLAPASSISIAPSISVVSEGSLIGNYDATANPTGTQTRPGLFGGSGNNQIPATIDIALAGSDSTVPSGGFRLESDLAARTFTLSALSADLLASEPLDVPLTIGLLYQTFRTIAPSSVYLGGTRLPIPFGSATISELSIRQLAPVPGALLPTDTPGVYSFSAIVPASLTATASFLTQSFTFEPDSLLLPITGTLDTRAPQPTLTLSWDSSFEQDLPPELIAQLPPIENQPFDIPTILPPGSTAHLLLNLTIGSGRIANATTATLIAVGAEICPGDFNQDGVIDAFDYGDFVDAFESGNPAADFNRDAFLDFFDYSDFVAAFTTGC